MPTTRSTELRRIRSEGDLSPEATESFPGRVSLQLSPKDKPTSSRSNSLNTGELSNGGSSAESPAHPLIRSSEGRETSAFRPGSPPPAIAEDPENIRSSSQSSLQSSPLPTLELPPPLIIVDHSPPQIRERSSNPHVPAHVLHNRPPPRQHNRSLYSRTMAFFGYGRNASRARRSVVSLIWNLAWGFTQIAVVIALIALSTSLESPTDVGLNEWEACNRPLGAWSCLWIVRVFLSCILTYWGYKRDCVAQARQTSDAENNSGSVQDTVGPTNSSMPTAPSGTDVSSANSNNASGSRPDSASQLPHTRSYRRLSLFSSLFSLSWFLTAHILEYTSINTCRLSSPHLWWLVFGILCITYLMVLEVIILGFVVFVIAPILFLFWNIFLMCLGRHPVQNPHMIKPDIGKLSKSIVDQIPLVMYIPPPPDAPSQGPVQIPEAVYTYPPKSPAKSAEPPKRRFNFLRIRSSKGKQDETITSVKASLDDIRRKGKAAIPMGEPKSWEDHWQDEGFPFVILEGNRATCAICLMDFEEPKRAEGVDVGLQEPSSTGGKVPEDTHITVEQREALKLEDAGEGAQPLRLLQCGHVFHKTCLDPWLTDVSGRCPVCQRPVDIPPPEKKRTRRGR